MHLTTAEFIDQQIDMLLLEQTKANSRLDAIEQECLADMDERNARAAQVLREFNEARASVTVTTMLFLIVRA